MVDLFLRKKNDYGNRIIREKTISFQEKNVLTQKKKSTEKIMKKKIIKIKEKKGKGNVTSIFYQL